MAVDEVGDCGGRSVNGLTGKLISETDLAVSSRA